MSALALDRLLDHLEQALGLGDAVDDEVTAEEPVARVLAVGLAHVEELDVGRVAADVVPEEREVVVEVLLVKGESHLLVHLLERRPALGEDRNGVDLLRDGIGGERRQRGVVDALGHPIVDERGEREFGAVVDRLTGGGHEGVAPGALQAGHLAKSGVLADGHRVGGPRGLKREPRAHLDDVAVELGRLGEEVGLEGLAQEPLERGHLVGRERGGDLDVEALLGDHGRDRAVHGVLGVGLAAQRGGASSLRKGRRNSCTTLLEPSFSDSESFPAAAAPGSATTARITPERRPRRRARWPVRDLWVPTGRRPAARTDARCAREEATALIAC